MSIWVAEISASQASTVCVLLRSRSSFTAAAVVRGCLTCNMLDFRFCDRLKQKSRPPTDRPRDSQPTISANTSVVK